jgi:hypothetical protein
MDKQSFIDSCMHQLIDIFEDAKKHQKNDKKKFRLEGFIHAGKALSIFSNEEAQELMEKAHFSVFGESIESRKLRKANIKEAVARGDDDYIDIPAYERNKGSS